jgi:hypothetical protein
MTIATRPLPDGRSYLHPDELPEMLAREELLKHQVYDDGKHFPTIGYGLNLNVDTNLALMLKSLGVFTASDAFWAANPVTPPESVSDRYYRIMVTFRAVFNAFPLTGAGNLAELRSGLNALLSTGEFGITTGRPSLGHVSQ